MAEVQQPADAGTKPEPEPEAEAETDADSRSFYTVFAGSSPEDVAYAKVFWSSLSLQPPLESRLVSGDIKQRLKAAPPAGCKPSKDQCCQCHPSEADIKSKQLLIEAYMHVKEDEKARYLEKAQKRMEILDLIKKQKEERIKKELVALPYKPKKIMQSQPEPASPDFSNEAQETYQALRQFD
ncbi:cilia- and flagella-associated protein HOATZ [Rhinoraja longicauda]